MSSPYNILSPRDLRRLEPLFMRLAAFQRASRLRHSSKDDDNRSWRWIHAQAIKQVRTEIRRIAGPSARAAFQMWSVARVFKADLAKDVL